MFKTRNPAEEGDLRSVGGAGGKSPKRSENRENDSLCCCMETQKKFHRGPGPTYGSDHKEAGSCMGRTITLWELVRKVL